ncbi:hypothetical protein ABPG74_008330 [Tetrahymena malaccensis]
MIIKKHYVEKDLNQIQYLIFNTSIIRPQNLEKMVRSSRQMNLIKENTTKVGKLKETNGFQVQLKEGRDQKDYFQYQLKTEKLIPSFLSLKILFQKTVHYFVLTENEGESKGEEEIEGRKLNTNLKYFYRRSFY